MNKEEIKIMIKDCVYSEDGIAYMSDKQYNNYINIIEQLEKENKILRENAENNDKVVDKVNWENQLLKKQLKEINKFKFSYKKDQTKIPPIIRKQKDVETIKKLENQQKIFIDWLENEKNIYPYDISDYTYEDIINTILSKYYEIIEKVEKGE